MAAGADVQMRDSDAFSWYMEQDPLLRSTIVAMAVLDSGPDWDRLVDKIDRATRQIPGFRQHVVPVPLPWRMATPRWTADRDFDLSWHVRRVEAPPPHDLGTVVEFARRAGMAAFDRARPMWEFTLIDGLDGGRSALVMKIHHSLTDGVGGMQLALLLFELQAGPVDLGPVPDAPAVTADGTAALGWAALGDRLARLARTAHRAVTGAGPAAVHVLRDPRHSVTDLVDTVESVYRMVRPINDTLSPVMRDRRLGWRYDLVDVPLAELKGAARSAGGTLNDGFLAGMTGGLRRYHEQHGAPIGRLRMMLPISIRSDTDPLGGNRISLLRFPVPAGIADPADRIRAMHDVIVAERHERALPYTNAVAAALNLLPTSYVGGMIKHVDFLASDVPGFPFPVYLAGSRVERYHAFGPTTGTAVNATLLSYCGTCHVGVTTDVGAIPDHDVFMDCLVAGFEEVLALSGSRSRVQRPLRPVRRRAPSVTGPVAV